MVKQNDPNRDITRKPDGRFVRDLGWKPDGKGGFAQHRFYLGRDRGEAVLRNLQLERVWDVVERRASPGERPMWDGLSMQIAQAVARGEAVVRVVPPLDAGLPPPVAEGDGVRDMLVDLTRQLGQQPLDAALWLRELQHDYPFVRLELNDPAAQQEGERQLAGETERQVQQAKRVLEEARQVPASGQTLHQALDAYAESIRRTYLGPGGQVTPGGVKMVRECKILKEHHAEMPLDCFGLNEIEAMINHWRHRPMTKRGKPCSPETSRDMIKRVRTFVRWLHKSPHFRWRKPADLEATPVRIAMTPEEVSARLSPAQVETYTLDELGTLYEYASPWERLLMLLGLNCGFGVAEVSTLLTTEIHLRQPHGHYRREGSFVKRVRFKSQVYGEWSLWSQTVAGVEWQLARRGESEQKALLLTRRGVPLSTPTVNNNRNNKIPNAWTTLLRRVRKDKHDFRRLSFNKLRKTAANLVRRFSDGETAAVFLCHGRPVKADALLDLYTDRHYDKVFAALDRVAEFLAPMFGAVDDPFPADLKKHNPAVSLGQIKRMRALRAQGHTLRRVGETVGFDRETVRRYCRNLPAKTGEEDNE